MKRKNELPPTLLESLSSLASAFNALAQLMLFLLLLGALMGIGSEMRKARLLLGTEAEAYAPNLYVVQGEYPIQHMHMITVDDERFRACALYTSDGKTYMSNDGQVIANCEE